MFISKPSDGEGLGQRADVEGGVAHDTLLVWSHQCRVAQIFWVEIQKHWYTLVCMLLL